METLYIIEQHMYESVLLIHKINSSLLAFPKEQRLNKKEKK